MEMKWLIEKLEKSFQSELPGWESQKKLSPGYDKAYRVAKPDALEASVLVFISPVNGIPHLNFIKRASKYQADKHKGQIGFAGGKIEHVGKITPLYIFVSNFVVHPFVAYANVELSFRLDETEVDELIQWPINLLQTGPLKKDVQSQKAILKNVPYYPLGNETLWGATSMITAEFLDML